MNSTHKFSIALMPWETLSKVLAAYSATLTGASKRLDKVIEGEANDWEKVQGVTADYRTAATAIQLLCVPYEIRAWPHEIDSAKRWRCELWGGPKQLQAFEHEDINFAKQWLCEQLCTLLMAHGDMTVPPHGMSLTPIPAPD